MAKLHRNVRWALQGTATAAISLIAAPLPAQQQGTVAGTVTDAATAQPLTGAQVFIPGTGRGSLTNARGTFVIPGVPVGQHRVQVQLLGYRNAESSVDLAAGGTTRADFALTQEALQLDEVVVTGTAGQARRREVGTSLAQIDLADVPETVPNVDNLLASQAPGLTVLRSGSSTGSGSQIRLRGNVSVAMSNQPLIYIDGVRIRSDGLAKNHAVGDHILFSNNDVIGPLNDINPSDIERIEVVKGPAATALYGTEAAGGVIQIITKRGSSGAPVWSAQIDQGVDWVQKFGPDNEPYMRMDPWIRNGHRQRYSSGVRGGDDNLRYYLSGTFENNQGTLPDDGEKKTLVRGNFAFQPLSSISVDWNTTFTRQDLQNTTMGGNPYSLMLNAYRAPQGRPSNYIGSAAVGDLTRLLEYDILTDVDRIISGLTATQQLSPGITNRVTIGVDRINSDMLNVRPFGYINHPQGAVSRQVWLSRTLTVDYLGTAELPLFSGLGSRLSWGAQYVENLENSVAARGDGLPGPGEHTAESGANIFGYEERERVINGGFFLQNLFSLKDRYFVTVAMRVDGNSAFGESFGLQAYPKATLSYVVSDESFWPESLGQVKLRAAWGHAGRAPGAFDAVRTWNAKPWRGATGFLPGNVGNADLGPERTIEWETGFDAGLLDGRLTLDFSYYNQRTVDALFEVQQTPSAGFGGSQLENVGEISNEGFELAASAVVVRNPGFTWDVGVNAYTNKSRVVSLGGAAPFSTGGGWIEEGGPVPAVRAHRITNPDAFAEPIIEQFYVWGPNQPTHSMQLSSAVGLPGRLNLSARGEYMGGHYIEDGANAGAISRGATTPFCDDVVPLLNQGQRDQFTARQRSWCDTRIQGASLVYPADFFRLRDVSLELPLPRRVVPGADRASFTASVQNVWTWKNKDFLAMDPEMAGSAGINSGLARSMGYALPSPASFLASLRVTF